MPRLPIAFAILLLAVPAFAEEKPVNFVRDIRPILAKNCFACHGPDEKQRKARPTSKTPQEKSIIVGDGDGPFSALRRRTRAHAPAESGKSLTAGRSSYRQWVNRSERGPALGVREASTARPSVKQAEWVGTR